MEKYMGQPLTSNKEAQAMFSGVSTLRD